MVYKPHHPLPKASFALHHTMADAYKYTAAYKCQKGFKTKHPHTRQKGYVHRGGSPKWNVLKKKVRSFSLIIKQAIRPTIKKVLCDLIPNSLPKGTEGLKKVSKEFLHDSGRNLVNKARQQYGFRKERYYPWYMPRTVYRVQNGVTFHLRRSFSHQACIGRS